jgi:hypothetical protein
MHYGFKTKEEKSMRKNKENYRNVMKIVVVIGIAAMFLTPQGVFMGIAAESNSLEAPSVIWNKEWDSGYDDIAYDVAVDSADNVIVAGSHQQSDLDWVCSVRKYDKDGNLIWAFENHSYGAWGYTILRAVTVDSNDNIFVAGIHQGLAYWVMRIFSWKNMMLME